MKWKAIAVAILMWAAAGAAGAVGSMTDVTVHDTYANLMAMGVIRAPRIATPFPGQFVLPQVMGDE